MKIKTHLSAVCFSIILLGLLSTIVYSQCIEGNCKNGVGTLVFPGGSRYIGEWKNGQMDGKGVFIFSSGAKYAGEWSEDRLIQYSYLENDQKSANILVVDNPNGKTTESDIEALFRDKDFDPSTDLPPAAAGFNPNETDNIGK